MCALRLQRSTTTASSSSATAPHSHSPQHVFTTICCNALRSWQLVFHVANTDGNPFALLHLRPLTVRDRQHGDRVFKRAGKFKTRWDRYAVLRNLTKGYFQSRSTYVSVVSLRRSIATWSELWEETEDPLASSMYGIGSPMGQLAISKS